MMENAFQSDAYIFKEGKLNLYFILSVCLNVYLYLINAEMNPVKTSHVLL